MASIETRTRKDGRTAYVLRFYRNGKNRIISFDSNYTMEDVEEAKEYVDRILLAEKKGEFYDRATRVYLETAPQDLQWRFASAGIGEAKKFNSLKESWREFIRWKYGQVVPSTQLVWKQIGDRLFSIFDGGRAMRTITEREAQDARTELSKVYREATVSVTIGRFRTFWTWAVNKGYAERNVFLAVKKGSSVNRSKDFQIPREWTERILDACPTQNWRTLFALWRIGGLRQQEPLHLTWDCVNWEKKRLLVYSPKTACYEGKESRLIPLFPILERELAASFEIAPEGEPYIVYENRRRNFDTGFKRILFWAGLTPWQKLFQNMRSSCENDLIEDGYPAHVVGAWIGHTTKVQELHYLRVLDSFFDMAVGTNQENAERTRVNENFCCVNEKPARVNETW